MMEKSKLNQQGNKLFHDDVHFNIFNTKLDFQSMELTSFHGNVQTMTYDRCFVLNTGMCKQFLWA